MRVDFVEEANPWSSFILEDGTRIRVRLILVSVDRTDQKLSDGQPAHNVHFQQVMEQIAPEPKITTQFLKPA